MGTNPPDSIAFATIMKPRTIHRYRSGRRPRLQIVLISCCLFVTTTWLTPACVTGQSSDQPNRLHPVPSKSELRETLKTIQGLYAEQYRNRTPQGRQKFAETLLVVGAEDEQLPAKYVLFSEALRISRELGDYKTAWKAINKLSQCFQLDDLKIRVDMLKDIGKKNRDPEIAYQLAFMVQPNIESFIAQDRFTAAIKLIQCIESIAKRSSNKSLARESANSEKNLELLAKRYAALESYRATLKTNPNDPVANGKLGQYYFFDKKNSQKGLPLLAKSRHPELAALAKRELQAKTTEAKIQDKLAIADDWWKLANAADEQATKDRLKNHAILLYSELADQLTGIDKVRVQKRINSQGLIQDEFFSSVWELRWQTQDDWVGVRFRKDGKVSYTIKPTQVSKTVPWQMTAKGIVVRPNQKRYFIFKLDDQRNLIGEKYEPTQFKERVTGVRVVK